MRYLLFGLLIGAIAGFLLFRGVSASEIIPAFYTSLHNDSIADDSKSDSNTFIVPMINRLLLVDRTGNPVRARQIPAFPILYAEFQQRERPREI